MAPSLSPFRADRAPRIFSGIIRPQYARSAHARARPRLSYALHYGQSERRELTQRRGPSSSFLRGLEQRVYRLRGLGRRRHREPPTRGGARAWMAALRGSGQRLSCERCPTRSGQSRICWLMVTGSRRARPGRAPIKRRSSGGNGPWASAIRGRACQDRVRAALVERCATGIRRQFKTEWHR